jgi:hypothetical protein
MKQSHPATASTGRRCPHCHGRAKAARCSKCNREMCQECISHTPSMGQVCGLCKDDIEQGESHSR